MDRNKAHQVVRITVGGLMGPGPLALEKANEYISEAEHQEGDFYWDQFDYEAELADDAALYLTECGYLGDGISGAGGNSHPLVGWDGTYSRNWEALDEALQDIVGDVLGAITDSKRWNSEQCLRDEGSLKEIWIEDDIGNWIRLTVSAEEYAPRFYDPPYEIKDTDEEIQHLYNGMLYKICEECGKIVCLGQLDEVVEETDRTYVWRDLPAARPTEEFYERDGKIRVAVSMERPSVCEECFEASMGDC